MPDLSNDPWWAFWATLFVVFIVGAPVVSGMVWVVFKIWIDILQMTGC